MTRSAGVLYFFRSDGAYARGRTPDLVTTTPATSRTNPARGTYMPNSNQYSGLLPGWDPADLTPVYPGSSGAISITAGGEYRNKIFWGQVKMQSVSLATFINCAFASLDGDVLQTTDQGAIKCYGTGYYQFTLMDCLIDGALWMDPTVVRPGGRAPTTLDNWRANTRKNVGIHGGRCTLQRVEIKNVVDSFAGTAKQSVGYESTFVLAEDCWFHQSHYYRNQAVMPTLPEGTHSDIVQPAIGGHMTFRGCYFGGYRDPVGYGTYLNGTPSGGHDGTFGWNSGDDAWNSCFYIAQESSVDFPGAASIDYLIIEECFFEGGRYCINHHYETSRPNLMANSAIRNNFFVRRADAKYVIRSSQYTSLYTNNRIIDVNPDGGFTIGASITYNLG